MMGIRMVESESESNRDRNHKVVVVVRTAGQKRRQLASPPPARISLSNSHLFHDILSRFPSSFPLSPSFLFLSSLLLSPPPQPSSQTSLSHLPPSLPP